MPRVEITAMTFGPFGIGRLDGETVMTPRAAPGDVLEVAIQSRHRDYLVARLGKIERPGAARRDPPCPFLPRCGGCGWQHLEYRSQLRHKGDLIAREVGRALEVELDSEGLVEPAPAEFGYRSRIRLKVGARGELGFREFGSDNLVAIDKCLVADEHLELPLRLAAEWCGRVSEIEVVRSGERQVIVADFTKPLRPADLAAARAAIGASARIAGVLMRAPQAREVFGDVVVAFEPEPGLSLRAAADAFSQINHAQNQKLVAFVMEAAAVRDGTVALDLFCGAGNLCLPAARRGARVLGADVDPIALHAADDNARRLGLSDARFVPMRATETAQFLSRAGYKPDLVMLDPPRTGARDLLEMIASLRPRQIIYVSCDPITLARDLRSLHARGYRFERMRGFDFFPNTHHIETVVHLVLT